MSTIYLAHVTVYDPAIAATKVLYFCTGNGFVTGTDAAKRPAGIPAHTYYEPRIKQPASMRRDCFSRGATGGASDIGYGEMLLVNKDGALDGFLDYGLDGRSIEILIGQMSPWQNPVFTTIIKGTMEQPRVSWDTVSIRLRDRQAELDKPVQATKYAGSNSLPNGLEGVAGDIKGQPKPRLYGKAFYFAPPCVNTSRLIYQVNDGAVQSVDAVYDRGAALAAGAVYTSQSDMETNAPSAGQYRAWPGGGYFRLGSSPAGQVTADATQGAAASNRTAAQVIYAVATGPGGIAGGDVVAADIAALDAANSAEVGIYIGEESTVRAALDEIANSVGAWWGFDRLGQFRAQRLELPSGTPVATISEVEIIKIDRIATTDQGAGVPSWRVVLNHKKFYAAQESDIAGVVTDARRAEIRNVWRSTVAEDAAVKTAHPLAPQLDFYTLLIDSTAAGTESSRRLTLYKTRRDRFAVRVALDAALAAAIDLGTVVRAVHTRFGLAAGKDFRVLGLQPDARTNMLDLSLWG